MPAFLRDRLFAIWALLVAVTLVSVQIGGPGRTVSAAATVAVLTMAFAKSWVVMFEFMELRRAPVPLRLFATTWLLVALSVLLAIYFGLFTV